MHCLHTLAFTYLMWVHEKRKKMSLGSLYRLKNTIENFTSRCHSYAQHKHNNKPVEARPQQHPVQWALEVYWAKEVLTGPSPFYGQWQVTKSARSIMRKRTSRLVHYVSACYDIVSIKRHPFTAICLLTRCREQKAGCGSEGREEHDCTASKQEVREQHT